MHMLGISGMPRRIMDYPAAFVAWNRVCSVGSYISALSLFLFFYIMYRALKPVPQSNREGGLYSPLP